MGQRARDTKLGCIERCRGQISGEMTAALAASAMVNMSNVDDATKCRPVLARNEDVLSASHESSTPWEILRESVLSASHKSSTPNDPITLLVEVAKITIPKRRGKREEQRGMHCTAYWVGPTNPSGRKRRQKMLHRTKTMKINKTADSDGAASTEDGKEDAVDCTEHIFTVDDGSLFLAKTTMKQLVNASVKSSDDSDNNFQCGGLRLDVFEKPIDILSKYSRAVLANDVSDKEANAVTTRESSSFMSYRLVGSVFLTPDEILSNCNEQRFEYDLVENWRKIHQGNNPSQNTTTKKVDGGRVALRVRLASQFDKAFMKSLAWDYPPTPGANGVNVALMQTSGKKNLKPAQIITEVDENVIAAETSMKAAGNVSPIAYESVRYMFSNDEEQRLLVKPFSDPERLAETTWFTEEQLHRECYKPSTNWIQAGQVGSKLGTVYLEILECRGLPNTDAGGAIGNKTDAFISVVYDDVMVQTEIIDDSCSPMWMPWTSRAFVFSLGHPSTAIFIGVADYDLGPLEHECIGRVAINLGRFSFSTLYTLTYPLYESSNLVEKGENMGTITVRLRIEVPDEKKFLMEGRKTPQPNWVNSVQWKSHRVAKYCVDGRHDEEVFEMALFRSHINELLTQKRYMSYAISDAVKSLVYWKGNQVKVGSVWLPLHSAIVYYLSIHVVENPRYLPSFILFGCGWMMIANSHLRTSHPNPWHRGHSFLDHWNSMIRGNSYHSAGKEIQPMQGYKETVIQDAKWKQRLKDDDDMWAKQYELADKIKKISDDAVIRTKTSSSATGALVDPISAAAGSFLLPYQKRLSGYCKKVRYVRNVLNWNESIVSFFYTLSFFGAAIVALFIPWRFILLWSSRLFVWVGLGPWMRIFDLFFGDDIEVLKAKATTKEMTLFHKEREMAKILRENTLKMKAFRVRWFGKFITRLPDYNLTRHEDVPLPESFAEPYQSEDVTSKRFIPSQDLSGSMVPLIGQNADERRAKVESEKDCLVGLYQTMTDQSPDHMVHSPEEDNVNEDEGFEIIGGSENQIICLPSESEAATKEVKEPNSTEITAARSNSERDIVVSDKAIQSALEKELLRQSSNRRLPSKSKWVFSATVAFSLRRETVDDSPAPPALETERTPRLCNDTCKSIEQAGPDEEGVEIVENDGGQVSTFYVRDESKQISNNENENEAIADGDGVDADGENEAINEVFYESKQTANDAEENKEIVDEDGVYADVGQGIKKKKVTFKEMNEID